ncbi:hypothetical protein [Streptomyces sp. NBC_01314]|uniref:hypothetical protein n=1 Tax=Streptomyces sp. NBC_01314 TaxID=2903821 RepID=UPI00308E269A|nr:hypothetical protein OG622_23030 [Streptomyces sp. NBC_01314]
MHSFRRFHHFHRFNRLYRFSSATGTTLRNRAQRGQRMSRPGPSRSACCIGNVAVLNMCPSAQRTTVRSIKSMSPFPKSHVWLSTYVDMTTNRHITG